jgi:hypothetical protein
MRFLFFLYFYEDTACFFKIVTAVFLKEYHIRTEICNFICSVDKTLYMTSVIKLEYSISLKNKVPGLILQ